MTRKISTRAAEKLLVFLIDFPEIFFFLLSFAFFDFCFFCLLVCCFLKLKMYILIHIRLSGWVNDFHPADFRKENYFFFWPNIDTKSVST